MHTHCLLGDPRLYMLSMNQFLTINLLKVLQYPTLYYDIFSSLFFFEDETKYSFNQRQNRYRAEKQR